MAEDPQGIQFPFHFADAGGVAKTDGVEKVKTNLENLAKTALRERLIKKTVGTIGYEQVLRNLDDAGAALIRDLVREAIAKHERRAAVLEVRITKEEDRDGTRRFIDVDFVFRETGQRETARAELA